MIHVADVEVIEVDVVLGRDGVLPGAVAAVFAGAALTCRALASRPYPSALIPKLLLGLFQRAVEASGVQLGLDEVEKVLPLAEVTRLGSTVLSGV